MSKKKLLVMILALTVMLAWVAGIANAAGTVEFTDSTGTTDELFDVTGPIYVTVTEAAANGNAGAIETVAITVSGQSGGAAVTWAVGVDTNWTDKDAVTLYETGANTGVFRNNSSGVAYDIHALFSHLTWGDTIGVKYTDTTPAARYDANGAFIQNKMEKVGGPFGVDDVITVDVYDFEFAADDPLVTGDVTVKVGGVTKVQGTDYTFADGSDTASPFTFTITWIATKEPSAGDTWQTTYDSSNQGNDTGTSTVSGTIAVSPVGVDYTDNGTFDAYYMRIQDAIDDGSTQATGSLIEVGAAYDSTNETFPIIVNKAVTIQAASGATPVIDASGTTLLDNNSLFMVGEVGEAVDDDAEAFGVVPPGWLVPAFWLVRPATLDGLHIKGADDQRVVMGTPNATGTYTVKNCILEVNYDTIFGSGIDFEVVNGITTTDCDLVATGNTIRAGDGTATGDATDGTMGIRLHGGGDCVITGNSIRNIFQGMQTFGWPLSTLDISNNEFSNIKTAAIQITSENGNVTLGNFTLDYNIFSSVGQGVYLLQNGGKTISGTLDLRYNKFDNADAYTTTNDSCWGANYIGYAVATSTGQSSPNHLKGLGDITGDVDASLNWWGSTAGPTIATSNTDGDGDAIDDQPSYRPWLNADPSSLFVDSDTDGKMDVEESDTNKGVGVKPVTLGTSTTYHWTISAAIAAASDGNTITVGGGTYAETIIVNIDNLTIQAASGANPIIESNATGTSPVVVNTDKNLTFDGIDLQWEPILGAATVSAFLHNGDTLDLKNCTINGGGSNTDATAGVYVDGDATDTTGTIDNVIVTNARVGIDLVVAGAFTITNSDINYNNEHGLQIATDGNTIGGSGNTINNNAKSGIYVISTGTGNTFTGNTIVDNTEDGVYLEAATGNVFHQNKIYNNDQAVVDKLQMYNNTTTTVDATNNWWGSADGPYNSLANPGGDTNNRVSNYIDFDPWWTESTGVPSDLATAEKNFSAGDWYLMSIPLDASPTTADSVIGDDLPGGVCGNFVQEYGSGYSTPTDIYPTGGYWLYAPEDITVDVAGNTPPSPYTVTLTGSGWHMIGAPFSVLWGEVKVDGTKISADGYSGKLENYIYEYSVASGYDAAQDPAWDIYGLTAWKGYWVEVSSGVASVQLAFESAAPSPPASLSAIALSNQAILITDPEAQGLPLPPAPPAVPQAAGFKLSNIQVSAAPNPASADTVTFMVNGQSAAMVEGLKVSVFDLAGQNLFAAEVLGQSLDWELQSVANGIYLYSVQVKVNGVYYALGVQKLLILR